MQDEPTGGAEAEQTGEGDKSLPLCDPALQRSSPPRPKGKIVEDSVTLESVRDRRTLLKWEGERIDEEASGPKGSKRRRNTRLALEIDLHDWRVGFLIAAIVLAIVGLLVH